MSTKKPTEKQLAARKRFAQMSKNGTLAKKRAKASLKAPATKTTTKRKKVVSAKKICRAVIKVPGINSRTGQLLKGWHYKNGKPVKATKTTKKVAKKGLKQPLAKPRKKATAKQAAAQKAFKANAAKARALVASGKVKTLKAAWSQLKNK